MSARDGLQEYSEEQTGSSAVPLHQTWSGSPRYSDTYLSPHCDDIAFSLGAFVSDLRGGTLVALFTRSAFTQRGLAVLHPDPETVERVTTMRRAEDESFCASVGLRRIELGLEEPSLRGRRTRDATGVADDVAQLEAPLVAELRRLFDEQPAPRRLFCPAGIGGHVNHLATRAVVVANLGWIAQQAEVLFYEDLHYASRPGARLRGLRDLRRALAGSRLVREAFPVRDRAAKLAMINAYPSQHLAPVLSLRQGYTPAAIWPLSPHEAVWRVLQ